MRAINRIVHHDSLIVSPDSRLRVVWGQSVTTWWVHLEGPPHAADARTLHPRATAPRLAAPPRTPQTFFATARPEGVRACPPARSSG